MWNAAAGERAGRTALMTVALASIAGLVALWLWSGERPQRPRGEVRPPGSESAAAPAAPVELAPVRTPAETSAGARAAADDELLPLAALPGAELAGSAGKLGSLRGHVELSGEEPFPRHWRLVARPSLTMPGREHAVHRALRFDDGRQDFELLDLPLGGYDVVAEAEGHNGQVLPIQLQPGSEHAFVNLLLVPAGFLEGSVVDAEFAPAEGVAITLIGVADNQEREAVTDPAGRFRFESVPDGAYELLIGRVASPVVPERRPLRFSAPSLTYPELQLPPLATLDLRVTDSIERPLEGVTVRGSGTQGGLIERTTDHDGRVLQKHLPAGHYRLRLEHPGLDPRHARRIAVDLEAGKVTAAPVRYGP